MKKSIRKWKAFAEKTGKFVFRYRFLTGGVLFLLYVTLGISGSPVGYRTKVLEQEDTGVLMGESRGIRTDEWAVSASMPLPQYQAEKPFQYFSQAGRGLAVLL